MDFTSEDTSRYNLRKRAPVKLPDNIVRAGKRSRISIGGSDADDCATVSDNGSIALSDLELSDVSTRSNSVSRGTSRSQSGLPMTFWEFEQRLHSAMNCPCYNVTPQTTFGAPEIVLTTSEGGVGQLRLSGSPSDGDMYTLPSSEHDPQGAHAYDQVKSAQSQSHGVDSDSSLTAEEAYNHRCALFNQYASRRMSMWRSVERCEQTVTALLDIFRDLPALFGPSGDLGDLRRAWRNFQTADTDRAAEADALTMLAEQIASAARDPVIQDSLRSQITTSPRERALLTEAENLAGPNGFDQVQRLEAEIAEGTAKMSASLSPIRDLVNQLRQVRNAQSAVMCCTSIGTEPSLPAHSAVYWLARDYSEKRTTMLCANTDLVAIPERLNHFADRSVDVTIDPALLSEPVAIVYDSIEQEAKAKNLFLLYRNKYDQYRDRGISAMQSAAMLFGKETDVSVTNVVNPHVNVTLPPDASRVARRHQQLSEEILALMSGDRHDPLAVAKLNQELFTKSNRFCGQGKHVAERYGWVWDAPDPSSTPRGVTGTGAFSLD